MQLFRDDKIGAAASESSTIDKDIYKYILNCSNKNFDDILIKDGRWQVLFHLSELRASLVGWYPFDSKSEVLEVAAGFGALTGCLCEHAGHVTVTERSSFRAEAIAYRYKDVSNLSIYVGDVCDISFDRKFDIIVLSGILELQGKGGGDEEEYIKYLQRMKSLLKDDGKLLIGIDNRYGLKYFCGEIEPYTREVFAGIRKYPRKGRGYLFSKQEIKKIISKAGFFDQKFYYPLPDYKLPQVIYSENFLPREEIYERIIPYYHSKDSMIASEMELYSDIIENNVFEFFANSFFIECKNQGSFCPIDYVAVTADRGKKRAIITTIAQYHEVKKTPLFKEGEKSIKKLFENMEEMKKKHLKLVSYKYNTGCIQMPFIKAPTLASYLKTRKVKDKKEVLKLFDMLWELIKSSSEKVSSEKNCFLSKYSISEKDWGIIISKAYMEMIPMNCFYDKGELIFFDQEFVKNDCPAKYPMFRALVYSQSYLRNIVSLDELKLRYALFETWDAFVEEEKKFIEKIRRYHVYEHFYKLAEIDWQRIEKNRKILTLLGNG